MADLSQQELEDALGKMNLKGAIQSEISQKIRARNVNSSKRMAWSDFGSDKIIGRGAFGEVTNNRRSSLFHKILAHRCEFAGRRQPRKYTLSKS